MIRYHNYNVNNYIDAKLSSTNLIEQHRMFFISSLAMIRLMTTGNMLITLLEIH